MKNLTTLLLSSSLFINAVYAQKSIQINNPLDKNRIEIISIPYAKFSKHFAVDSIFTIKQQNSANIFVHQLEKKGTNTIQNVLIQVPIASKGSLILTVEKEKSPDFKAQTYARYVPERMDDFAWENDIVAFRMYGKALEGRADDAQGIDFWAKRTTALIINKWYKEDDYHKDHGQGLDYYAVGQTLGAGDLALYFNDNVSFTKHYSKYNILDNGPLRSTFVLEFEEQDIDANKVSLTKTITLDAGQQFNKIVVSLDNKSHKSTPVVVGLARRGEENPKINFDPRTKSLAYWEPSIKDYGHTGTAVVLPQAKIDFIKGDKKQFLLKTAIVNKKPFTYYNGASWNKDGKITSAEQWNDYVEIFADRLQNPLHIKLK